MHTESNAVIQPVDASIAKAEIKEEDAAMTTADLVDNKEETPFATYKEEPKVELEPPFESEPQAENNELVDPKDEAFETMQVDGANDEKPVENKPTEQRKPTVMNLQSVLPNVKATILNTGGEDQPGSPKTVVVLNKDGTRMTLQLVSKPASSGATNATVVCQSSTGTTSTSTVAALAQAIEARKMVTRSKTGSLTPKQFADSVTPPHGSLKIALTKCIEDSPHPSSLTSLTNKEVEPSYLTRSTKISIGNVSSTVLSQRSLFFKLGKL